MKVNLQIVLNTELNRLKATTQMIQWDSPWQYGAWLWQTHYFVCHSTRLLALAASRFPSSQSDMHSRFLSHASEEKGHEILALKDYKALREQHDELPAAMEELTSTQLFYESQYYWIEHRDPSSFFGYILILEGMASTLGKGIHETTRDAFGDACATFLKVHAEEDPDHIRKAIQSVEKLPDHAVAEVIRNLKLSSEAYIGICRDIAAINRSARSLVA